MNSFIKDHSELLLILIILFGINILFLFVYEQIIRKHQEKNRLSFFVKLLYSLRWPLYLVIPITILHIFSSEVLHQGYELYFHDLINALFAISLSWLIIELINIIAVIIVTKYHIKKIDNLRERRLHTRILLIKKILIILTILTGLIFFLMTFKDLRYYGVSIFASAGVLSVIIGFAAQKSLANLLAGLQIAFTQPIRIDDVVIVENELGKIEEITLTYVVIHLWDERRMILPINYFLEKPFQNWTRITSDLIGTIFLYTDYTINVAALRLELTRILKDTDLWDGVVNELQVSNTTAQGVEIRILASARSEKETWNLRCYIREKMIMYIQKELPNALPQFRILNLDRSTEKNSRQ